MWYTTLCNKYLQKNRFLSSISYFNIKKEYAANKNELKQLHCQLQLLIGITQESEQLVM